INQAGPVHGIARRAGGKHPNRRGAMLASHPLERRDGPGRLRDGVREKYMRLVKAAAKAGLLALFKNWTDAAGANLRYQKLYGICANIDHRLPPGYHKTYSKRNHRTCPRENGLLEKNPLFKAILVLNYRVQDRCSHLTV